MIEKGYTRLIMYISGSTFTFKKLERRVEEKKSCYMSGTWRVIRLWRSDFWDAVPLIWALVALTLKQITARIFVKTEMSELNRDKQNIYQNEVLSRKTYIYFELHVKSCSFAACSRNTSFNRSATNTVKLKLGII